MGCEYTQGPWSYYKDSCRACDEKGEAEFVIMEPPGGDHGQFSNEADARLIAAAPELLEGCKDALRVLEAMGHKDTVCAIDLRTLISKAEGK